MIHLLPVQPHDRDQLWNINQKYLYEMTMFYPDELDESRNLHYGHFEEYFTDPKRSAFFIYNGDVLVGFAMLCPYTNLGRSPDYTMAEFTIFPSYRRRHFALDAARQILETHPGQWKNKYNEKNLAGKSLWHAVTAPFKPEVCHLNDEETVLVFTRPKD